MLGDEDTAEYAWRVDMSRISAVSGRLLLLRDIAAPPDSTSPDFPSSSSSHTSIAEFLKNDHL
jgi:hypothetical protein